MRILLMLPYDRSYNRDMPDLGLGYLAACLQKDGHTVQLCIRPQKFASPSAFSDFIRRGRFEIFGIKVMSFSIIAVKETISLIRNINPNAIIILGGPHVSGDPYNIFRLIPEADYAFYGEAEIGLVEFVRRFSHSHMLDNELNEIPNLIWRKGPETVINERIFVDDLDMLSFPAWELMEPKTFPNIPFNGYSRRYPIAPMILTRGCPSRCTFCEAGIINGYKLRSRSVENIMQEIKLLTTRFGVNEIQFFDSNCADPRGPLREVCKRIISENIDITWCAPNGIRIDSIDKELVDLMKQSNCFQVNVGIESGSPRILKQIRKRISPDMVREKISLLRKAEIEVLGFFMIGFLGETATEIKQTISFAMELPLTGASFSILSPLPGTDIYKEVYKNRNMEIETLSSLDFIKYRNDMSEVPYDQLRKIQKNAYLHFHLRPRIIKYFLKNVNSVHKLLFLANRVYVNAFMSRK